ncbi:MAG: undecaprenyldiphospho-muramoylpentapeptide beta-N-acetylglucosaminyltransferase [bacterium]
MRIAFAGGGTGGHLFPGLSLAQELHRRDPAGHLLFLCTDRDGTYGGLTEPWLEVAVLPGSNQGALPRRLAGLLPAAGGALRQLLRFRPDLVVGLGGYGSLAPVLCARVLGIPSLLLEQNVVPGRANRLLARLADEVACQWAESARYFDPRRKVSVTGNPIRTGIRRAPRAEAAAALGLDPSAPTLLVMGGSQGARPLNNRIVDALPHFAEAGLPVQFVHLAGRADRERVAAAYAEQGLRAAVRGFLDDMALAYGACDLALSRAGGTSIAELTALGIPALLVPLPHAADDHQRLNARVLEYQGAALVVEQDELTAPGLARHVVHLLDDPERLRHMAARSRAVGVPRAASVVADHVEAVLSVRNGGGQQGGYRDGGGRA